MKGSEAGHGSATVHTISITILSEGGFACTRIPISTIFLLSTRGVYTDVHNHFIHNSNKEVLLSVVTGKILIQSQPATQVRNACLTVSKI